MPNFQFWPQSPGGFCDFLMLELLLKSGIRSHRHLQDSKRQHCLGRSLHGPQVWPVFFFTWAVSGSIFDGDSVELLLALLLSFPVSMSKSSWVCCVLSSWVVATCAVGDAWVVSGITSLSLEVEIHPLLKLLRGTVWGLLVLGTVSSKGMCWKVRKPKQTSAPEWALKLEQSGKGVRALLTSLSSSFQASSRPTRWVFSELPSQGKRSHNPILRGTYDHHA